jgi:hypothetical protein
VWKLLPLLSITLAIVAGFALQRRHAARSVNAHAAHARIAAELAGTITDPEVASAWIVICDALARGWLAGAAEVDRLHAELARGGGVQLAEEVSIDLDDEAPGDRVLLYHIGFEPNHRSCPRAAFLHELARLAAALTGP